MAKILGLDLGTNSIGWALIDDVEKSILGSGSRIFPEGVENLGEGDNELSKNATRTAARGTRRQFYRRRMRKRILIRELSKIGMCPLSIEQYRIWRDTKQFPSNELKEWFALNPYKLRAKAITEKVELYELGRIFYHMIQRRGFQSNSRSAGKDDGAIFKGKPKEGKIGIDDTRISIEGKTLGSYLHSIAPKENKPFVDGLERIRNRYTTRQMYINEFEQIWEVQEKYHSELTTEIKELLGGRKKEEAYKEDGVLFHQRPLKSQKHLVGYCTLEPKKTKCPLSAIPFEKFRIYQWVNTVECNGEKLSKEERETVAKLLFSKEKPVFKAIRKAINKFDSEYKFNYKDDDKIVGSYTISNLSNKKFFGNKWFDFTEKEQEDIWHVLYSFEDISNVKEYAISKWNFTVDQADKIAKFNLKEGYANLSRKAITQISPFLELGFTYDIAVAIGGVKNAMGAEWDECQDFVIDNVPDIVRSNISGGYIEPLKEMLKHEFNLNDKQLNKLYHHSTSINATRILDKLPVTPEANKQIQNLRNPIVVTALFELRKLVNELIETYGKPDTIKVEMARDLKQSKTGRNKQRREQKRLERENDDIKSELDKIGQRPTHINLLKYKLWEECQRTCPYTGKKINVTELFTGNVQIEHIHPWSRSLNDSFMNKTLCFADENRAKGDQTPYEFYSKQGKEKWELVKTRALKLFYDTKDHPNRYKKFKRFVSTKLDEDFISRQLNDTRYISKEAKNYMGLICDDVQISPGQATATLRHHWGLNNILNLEDDSKSRDDHRHHAVDALVMACTKRSYLQELSKWNRYNRNYELKEFPMPWDGFRADAEKSIAQILVSHKKRKNIITVRNHTVKINGVKYTNKGVAARDQLHKETVFGKRQSPHCLESHFHVRKPISSLTTKKQVNKVVDPFIRKLIHQRVEEIGGYEKEKNVPKGAFFDENGIPQIYLPNKNGEPVPVKKVRMKETIGGAEKLKDNVNQWVNPRNNHHVLIYKDEQGKLKEDVVTFWTVVERKKQGEPTFKLPPDGVELITTLQINDMFLLGLNEEGIDWSNLDYTLLRNHLYRVQKFTSGDYYFRKNTESNLGGLLGVAYEYIKGFGDGKTGWMKFNPIKVKLSSSGRITKL
jgi:CRISPR-associated endonuclease Csn1